MYFLPCSKPFIFFLILSQYQSFLKKEDESSTNTSATVRGVFRKLSETLSVKMFPGFTKKIPLLFISNSHSQI